MAITAGPARVFGRHGQRGVGGGNPAEFALLHRRRTRRERNELPLNKLRYLEGLTHEMAGIVSAEAVALMEGIVKSMTNAKLILVTAAVLFAGLVTARAGVMGYSAIRAENPALAGAPQQEARQPAAAAQVAQEAPRPAATKPATDQGPLVIQAEVVDPQGHPCRQPMSP